MTARKPKSPIDDIIKLLAKEGVKVSKKTALDLKRYARGIGRSSYLDRKPAPMKLKTPAQKKVKSRLEMIEDRRQDKGSRLYGDNNGPVGYFFGDDLKRSQKKLVNQGFAAEERIGAANARKARQVAKTPAKKAPVKKAAPKKKK